MKYKSFLISAHLGEKKGKEAINISFIIIDSSRWCIINLSCQYKLAGKTDINMIN